MKMWAGWALFITCMYIYVFTYMSEEMESIKDENHELYRILVVSFTIHILEIFINGFAICYKASHQLILSYSIWLFTTGYCGIYGCFYVWENDRSGVILALLCFRLLFCVTVIIIVCACVCSICKCGKRERRDD